MNYKTIKLENGYKPSDKEPFMCEKHRAYFYKKLLDWQDELERQIQDTLARLKESAKDLQGAADEVDRANEEAEQLLGMRKVERNRLLIKQIQKAFARLDNKNYGYCVDTGEPIELERLEIRLIATRTADAQANHEDNDLKQA
ncbi:MAG: TraR/DksA C4-type zinc finger protein [Alphaproteobacteria bacterium]|nr:TraR/DksA C4-type zinc finger protein [Alphaproteobacteria bacterium]MBN2779446.1 TraR/DksA C4-type zinc finger protein [Alphaproteobacteria bacterium]